MADWTDYIGQLIFIIFFILMFTGVNQRVQMKIWAYDIRNKLNIIKSYVDDGRKRVASAMRKLGIREPDPIINRYMDFFIIDPVDKEPIDIIRRLDHLLTTREKVYKGLLVRELPEAGKYERSLLESSLEIIGALNSVYKTIRHYLLLGEKHNNWILIMQLEFIMPEIMRIVETYHKALDPFMTGRPVGDSAGPLVAHRIMEKGEVVSKRIIEDTLVAEVRYLNRRIYVIKAEGPGSNVGKPGKVLARIVEELNGNIDLIITVDAALKLEGEENGEIAEGVGAAIGDPGPEKIAIERAASKYDIPLRAIVIKMGLQEALHTMRKEIYEAVERAVEYVEKLILEHTDKNSTVIVAGIGNSIGVAQ